MPSKLSVVIAAAVGVPAVTVAVQTNKVNSTIPSSIQVASGMTETIEVH